MVRAVTQTGAAKDTRPRKPDPAVRSVNNKEDTFCGPVQTSMTGDSGRLLGIEINQYGSVLHWHLTPDWFHSSISHSRYCKLPSPQKTGKCKSPLADEEEKFNTAWGFVCGMSASHALCWGVHTQSSNCTSRVIYITACTGHAIKVSNDRRVCLQMSHLGTHRQTNLPHSSTEWVCIDAGITHLITCCHSL